MPVTYGINMIRGHNMDGERADMIIEGAWMIDRHVMMNG